MDPDSEFIEGRTYAVRVNGGEIAAQKVYNSGRSGLKLVTGDGYLDEVARARAVLLGPVRWTSPREN